MGRSHEGKRSVVDERDSQSEGILPIPGDVEGATEGNEASRRVRAQSGGKARANNRAEESALAGTWKAAPQPSYVFATKSMNILMEVKRRLPGEKIKDKYLTFHGVFQILEQEIRGVLCD